MAARVIATTTEEHTFTIVEGQLTVAGEDKILTLEETGQLLDVLHV